MALELGFTTSGFDLGLALSEAASSLLDDGFEGGLSSELQGGTGPPGVVLADNSGCGALDLGKDLLEVVTVGPASEQGSN